MKPSLWSRFAHFHLTAGHIIRAALIIGAYLLVYDVLSANGIWPFLDRVYTGVITNQYNNAFYQLCTDQIVCDGTGVISNEYNKTFYQPCDNDGFLGFDHNHILKLVYLPDLPGFEAALKELPKTGDTVQTGSFIHVRFIGRFYLPTDPISIKNHIKVYSAVQLLNWAPTRFYPYYGYMVSLLPAAVSLIAGFIVFFYTRSHIDRLLTGKAYIRQHNLCIIAAVLIGMDVALLFKIINIGCG